MVGSRAIRAPAPSLFAGAVALALTLLQLAGAGHFLLVAHEVCPEHGEFVHHHAASATARSYGPGLDLPQAIEEAGSHEHCSVLMHQRSRLPAGPVPSLAPPPPPAPLCLERASQQAPEAVPLLAVAPKGSPPPSAG